MAKTRSHGCHATVAAPADKLRPRAGCSSTGSSVNRSESSQRGANSGVSHLRTARIRSVSAQLDQHDAVLCFFNRVKNSVSAEA